MSPNLVGRGSRFVFFAVAIVTALVPNLVRAADEMSCATRVESKTWEMDGTVPSKIFVNCPSDSRSGFLNPWEAPTPSRIDVTIQSANGKTKEVALTREQATSLFGDSNESSPGKTLSMLSISDSFNRSTGGILKLSNTEMRTLGLDPNAVGDTTLSIRNLTLAKATVLKDANGNIVMRPKESGQSAETRCMYVGRMKIVSGTKGGLMCADVPALCTAAVECLDEKVGWVTRSAACKAENGKCPSSADSCAAGGALAVASTSIENASQPNSRPLPSASGGTKK